MARRRLKSPKGTGIIRDVERMRITIAGLLVSGPTAYPSNMYEVLVTVNNKEYKSNEMAYQCKKATKHNLQELADAIDEMTSSWEIKNKTNDITVSDKWNQHAPDLIWDLFINKNEPTSQTPEPH